MDAMDKPEGVRVATIDDEASLFWHAMSMEADNSLHIPVNEGAVFETVHACCTGDYSIAGIIDGHDAPVASIGIRGVYPWFSKTVILSQIWLFVSPEARAGARLADMLFRFAEWHRQDMSKRLGYDMVLENTVMSFKRLDAKLRLWRRYGTQMGGVFWSQGERLNVQDQKDDQHDQTSRPRRDGRLQRHHSTSPVAR